LALCGNFLPLWLSLMPMGKGGWGKENSGAALHFAG